MACAVELNDYQHANLLALLAAVMRSGDLDSPLYIWNTGDWVGEVFDKLGGLPTVTQMYGSDPDFTGGVSSTEYVQHLRRPSQR